MAASSQPSVLALTFNHVVLPPKLPGEKDAAAEDVNRNLISRLLDATELLTGKASDAVLPALEFVHRSLESCKRLNENEFVSKAVLLNAFRSIESQAIILRITEQNAGLLIRQSSDDENTVIFEAFETSPVAKQTLDARGAMLWDFPGVAVSLPLSEFEIPDFQDSLATFIEKASLEALDQFAAKAWKAGAEIAEARDTVDPALITQFLMTFLEAHGGLTYPPLLRKRVKDDVCWNKSELPWRRSPLWLVLRVTVQRLLYLSLGEKIGRAQYKFLMCLLLARLLGDSTNVLHPELCDVLRAKLCRRLAKLEKEKANSVASIRALYTNLFNAFGPLYRQTIDATLAAAKNEWSGFKRQIQRKIPILPLRAHPQDLSLSLSNSLPYLDKVLYLSQNQMSRTVQQAVDLTKIGSKTFMNFSNHYGILADMELDIESRSLAIPTLDAKRKELCVHLSKLVENYLMNVANSYDGDPEQTSTFVLNTFDLWVQMDKCAASLYPLLLDYHPFFKPEMLDVLMLSQRHDMERLQQIQIYLQKRCAGAHQGEMTIFEDPSEGCFGDRYFENEHLSADLQALQRCIEAASMAAYDSKKRDLKRVNKEFTDLTEKKSQSQCTQRLHNDGTHDIRGCSHCYYIRSRRRLKISIHEDSLPKNTALKRAVVFELGIPDAYAAYRSTTWSIINILSPRTPVSQMPEVCLHEYSQLSRYNKLPYPGFSLASDTKSHLGTHYKWKSLPASEVNVLRPFGLTLAFYDSNRKRWYKDLPLPMSLSHHFRITLPKELPFATLYSSAAFAADGPGPSSYEVIANTAKCPAELSVHEYAAHQNLMSGKGRRWYTILAELGSSNLNLGTQDITTLFARLALQAGPGTSGDSLRVIHSVFKYPDFCARLIEQIDKHVEAISVNWRESNYMETLLTLSIRVCTLCCEVMLAQAKSLLAKIRSATFTWMTRLRDEIRTAEQADTADKAAQYAFRAALLCRRTLFFQACCDKDLDSEAFGCFVEASLALQEYLIVDLDNLTSLTRNMLVRDIKMTARIKSMLRDLAMRYPASLESAIKAFWPHAQAAPRLYSKWCFQPNPFEWWIQSTVEASQHSAAQAVHYHLLNGSLLVDGKPLGKLPSEVRDSEVLKEMFDNQRLVAFPSNLPGMSYVLGSQKQKHEIHIGYRETKLIIRARTPTGKILEYVQPSVFGNDHDLDLPASLINDCVHWVDVWSGVLHIRKKSKKWVSRDGDWQIDLRNRRGWRGSIFLVDPRNRLFNLIAQIFRDFEHPHMLTITQSLNKNLSVELKRMDLSFVVNRRGLLHCKELASEVDPNQDIGTFYGLKSMLVFRDGRNHLQRSVIVTLGKIRHRLCGVHVAVNMENTGSYGRYIIDTVLGRLLCPPDLLLLYNKARLHALTSFVLPDPLTGRTGTEEALCCLNSGYSHPWTPLYPELLEVLKTLRDLTPRRHYYPKNWQGQQIVHWNPQLTATIQHDAYQSLVESILRKSDRLSLFHRDSTNSPITPHDTVEHLRDRSRWRRSVYERSGTLCKELTSQSDVHYSSRDHWVVSKQTRNAREIITLLQSKPSAICTTHELANVLQKWSLIGGYVNEFTPHTLENCLSANILEKWGSLVNRCKRTTPEDVRQLMFELGAVGFRDNVDMRLMRTMIAFFALKGLRELDCPLFPSFTGFKMHEAPNPTVLEKLVWPFCKEFVEPLISNKNRNRIISSERVAVIENARQEHLTRCKAEVNAFVDSLIQQWPDPSPSVVGLEVTVLKHIEALQAVLPEWQRLYQNLQLSNHLTEVQAILNRHNAQRNEVRLSCLRPEHVLTWPGTRQVFAAPRLEDLLQKAGPTIDVHDDSRRHATEMPLMSDHPPKYKLITVGTAESPESHHTSLAEIDELERIVDSIMEPNCSVRLNYGQDLKQSIAALRTTREWKKSPRQIALNFKYEIIKVRKLSHLNYIRICNSLSHGDSYFTWLERGRLWPQLTQLAVLKQLRSTSECTFGPGMKDAIISYALGIINLQRLLRMYDAWLKRDQRRLDLEHKNVGHGNWTPSEYPDWLLLEIDSNMQIRDDQVTVALEMIAPTSDANSVLQMNMGQGKTSVIMPMVACIIADRRMLSRLLVPKALLSQTAQILQFRLGGLLGRETTYIPFSRRTPTRINVIEEYFELHNDMLRTSGIILGIPEHALSFKLSGLQRLSDARMAEATRMIDVQSWMDRVCRDILDECDFTLAVKTQLIYPSGSQLTVDGHPHRWKVIQILLSLVESHLHDLVQTFPQSVNVVKRAGAGFPIVYFLRKDAEETLIQKVVDDISSGQMQLLPIQYCTNAEQDAIRAFIAKEKTDPSNVLRVKPLFQDTPKFHKTLYLLRGLIAHGILLLCLKKRWNVQYGLHPSRDPIAVPFHAKGVPSEQAEWGHPDVAIVFTCLAFYYEGLSEKQLKQSLQAVLNSDDPATEYDRWTQASPTLPEALRQWNIINVDDDKQIVEIWNNLRFTTVVINYFLNRFVFPVHSKQFSVKLQASGWDIPLFSNDSDSAALCYTKGKKRPGLTTGFSGTNDNRRLLPLTIEQQDLTGLSHTNAEVLTYLLQKRNRHYMLAADATGTRLSELALLKRLASMHIRILLDAGAFILEMQNKALVRAWLNIDDKAKAGVFFGGDNKPWVVYKSGKTIPLLASPFVDNLEECLVYIDQAHTRGTDLSLPVTSRGALTLGVHQTKDHTVQAAMRLRQLGTTQAVTFVAPPEVHYNILDVCKMDSHSALDSSHVVTWLLDQTCATNHALQPLYFAQGGDFCRRIQAEQTYKSFLTDVQHRKAFLQVLQQREQRTLEELYEPEASNVDAASSSSAFDGISMSGRIRVLIQTLKQNQLESPDIHRPLTNSALEEVEQEREVAYEVEEEREVERPILMTPLKFPGLHKSILNFAKTGLLEGSQGYLKASAALDCTQLAAKYRVTTASFLPHLYISDEFRKTVKLKPGEKNDTFTRPVNWVIWSPRFETALVIIPEEAEALLPIIRTDLEPSTYLLLYAAAVAKRMVHFNRPGYCAIPSLPENFSVPAWFSIELGLFAGRLYFDFSEYDALLDCLQGTTNNLPSQQSQQSNDLKVLTTKTLGFLQEWMALRRQGQDITHTPMGYACQGWRLRSDHPFFTARVSTPQNYRIGFTPSSSQDHEEDDYDSGDDCSDGDDGLAYDEDEIEKEDEKYFESGFDEDIEEKIVDDDEVTEREEAQKLN